MSQFGIGVDDPRDGAQVDADRQAEERAADHQGGVVTGKVSEVRSADHVPYRKYALVGGGQALVDNDTLRPAADAGGLEVEIIDIRPTAGGDEEMGAFDRFDSIERLGQHDAHFAERARN